MQALASGQFNVDAHAVSQMAAGLYQSQVGAGKRLGMDIARTGIFFSQNKQRAVNILLGLGGCVFDGGAQK